MGGSHSEKRIESGKLKRKKNAKESSDRHSQFKPKTTSAQNSAITSKNNSIIPLKKSNDRNQKLTMANGKLTKRKNNVSSNEKNGQTPTECNSSILKRLKEKEEREGIVLWRRPILTINYFIREFIILLQNYSLKLWRHRRSVLVIFLVTLLSIIAYLFQGPHQKFFHSIQKKFVWCSYWIGLGVLSSIGLGTGLHTFLLYLGPHIASVTLAAYECGSLHFPEPPYPDEIICPDEGTMKTARLVTTIWDVMSKVRLEAFMWGAGTALGELPPYFMARASRLSGLDPDDGELEEYEQLLRQQNNEADQSVLDRAKHVVQKLVGKVGFFGILACASIPNPLFDLAGITCGHFLVPFWTFFGATLIGKAVIKMHIQKLFVIIAFNEEMVAKAVSGINYIPYVGNYLQAPFKEFLIKQKAKLHRKAGTPTKTEGSWLSWVFEKFVIIMVIYFVLSIVNSLAQNFHKRLNKRKRSSSTSSHQWKSTSTQMD